MQLDLVDQPEEFKRRLCFENGRNEGRVSNVYFETDGKLLFQAIFRSKVSLKQCVATVCFCLHTLL